MNKSITDMSIGEILTLTSKSSIDFTQDLFNKPHNISFLNHFQYSLIKDDRYAFIGLLLIGISTYGYLVNKK